MEISPIFSNKNLYKIKMKGQSEKFQKPEWEILLIFDILKWKFTEGTNKLLVALFDHDRPRFDAPGAL